MKLDHPELQSRLAAEYVLGTMHGRARRRFETYLLQHPTLLVVVAKWEALLLPLTDGITPVVPPARVWEKISRQIGFGESQPLTATLKQNAAKSATSRGLFQNFVFWRALGLGASVYAIALTAVLVMSNGWQASDLMLTSVLEDKGIARMVVEQPKTGMLMVKMVKPWKPAPTNSFQLWVMPKDGPPRAIGIINQDGATTLKMQEMDTMLTDGLAFAVTREPMGGSASGVPSGAILCKGVIAKMPPKKPAKPQI